FAVGDAGLVLERVPGSAFPWRRVDVGLADYLTAVTLPAGGGDGALIGGHNGLILTYVDGAFHVARPADYGMSGTPSNQNEFGELTGYVAGLPLLPGDWPGQLEALAAIAGRTAARFNFFYDCWHRGFTAALA